MIIDIINATNPTQSIPITIIDCGIGSPDSLALSSSQNSPAAPNSIAIAKIGKLITNSILVYT